MDELKALQAEIAVINRKWWFDDTGAPIQTPAKLKLMLVLSELSEAMEGERKDLNDTHLTHRKMAEVEMADAFIRLLDFAHGYEMPLRNDIFSVLRSSDKGEQLFDIADQVCQIWNTSDLDNLDDVALTDAHQMIQEYCTTHGYDLKGAVVEKMEYNKTRSDHKKESREAANGKKW